MAGKPLLAVRDGKHVRSGNLDCDIKDKLRKPLSPKHKPIGDPPVYFDDDCIAIWNELKETLPWLRFNHRVMFEVYVRYTVKFRYDFENFKQQDAQILLRCADRLGGNPVSDQFFDNEPDAVKDEFFDR